MQTYDSGIVPARKGKAVRLSKGQSLKLINTYGHQVVDTWAFNADDLNECLSMEHTRALNANIYIKKSDKLYTNKRRVILELVEDTWGGEHDTLVAACDVYRYQLLNVAEYHDNCTDNLYAAMRMVGEKLPEVPSPLNLWMSFPVKQDGTIPWNEPENLQEGDSLVLRAHMDCIVALSCCPQDIIPIHGSGAKPSDVHYAITD